MRFRNFLLSILLIFSVSLAIPAVRVWAEAAIRCTLSGNFNGHLSSLSGTNKNCQAAFDLLDDLETGGDPAGVEGSIQLNDDSAFSGSLLVRFFNGIFGVRGTLSGETLVSSGTANCDTLDTNDQGEVVCGSDSTGTDSTDDLSDNDTDDLAEGSTNKYTQWRADGSGIEYPGSASGQRLHAQQLMTSSGAASIEGDMTAANVYVNGQVRSLNSTLVLRAGDGLIGAGNSVNVTGGSALAGVGGEVYLLGGVGSNGFAGGVIDLEGGDGGSTGGAGGQVQIRGGAAQGGNSNGGDLWLMGGRKNGNGTVGKIKLFKDSAADFSMTLNLDLISSANRTLNFQDKTGTVALLSVPQTESFITSGTVSAGTASGLTVKASNYLATSGSLAVKGNATIDGTLSGSSLVVSNLKSCDTIDTNANGVLVCGSDGGGGGSSPSTNTGSLQMSFDSRYLRANGDTGSGTFNLQGTTSGLTLKASNLLTSSGAASIEQSLSVGGAISAASLTTIGNATVKGTLSGATLVANQMSGSLIAVTNQNGLTRFFYPIANTNSARGAALLNAIASLTGSSSLLLGPGVYDVGTNAVTASQLPKNVSVQGAGINATIIRSSMITTGGGQQVIVKPNDRNTFSDLTFHAVLTDGNFQYLFGNSGTANGSFTGVVLRDVGFKGDSDGIQILGSARAGLDCFNCVFEAAYHAVRVASNASHVVNLYNPKIKILGPSATGDGVGSSVSVDQGTIRVFGGSLETIGGGTNFTASVDVGHASGVVELYGTRVRTADINRGLNLVVDLYNRGGGAIRVTGGEGSNTTSGAPGFIKKMRGSFSTYIPTGTISFTDTVSQNVYATSVVSGATLKASTLLASSGALSVEGAMTASGGVKVQGATDLRSTLAVAGASTFKAMSGTQLTVNPEAYTDVGWNGDYTVPTRDDLRDLLQSWIANLTVTNLVVTGTSSGTVYQVGPIPLFGPNAKVATTSGADIFFSQSGYIIRTIWDTHVAGSSLPVGVDDPSGLSIYSSNPSITDADGTVTESALITNGRVGPYRPLTAGIGTVGANANSGATVTFLVKSSAN